MSLFPFPPPGETPVGGEESIDRIGRTLLNQGEPVDVPTWQALDVTKAPQGKTIEIPNLSAYFRIPASIKELQDEYKPNLPWAENQFLERVGGEPLNPGETFKEWPWYRGNVEKHKEQGKFSHTYMERYWPHFAEILGSDGIRRKNFKEYGDLNDVVDLLKREPTTRQAYLPVFFPEDTGAVHGERVPCSLGYLFLMRRGRLNITYHIRSCDFYRHFRDDIYMTARLCQWVLQECRSGHGVGAIAKGWESVEPGTLTMHIGSLHVFEGDLPKMRKEYGA